MSRKKKKITTQNVMSAPADISVSPPPEDGTNPLLSELRYTPRLEGWVQKHPRGAIPALIAFLGALTAIILSKAVGAACIRVTLCLVDANGNCIKASNNSKEIIFGYLGELNAGFFYLVGVPIFILVGFYLLNLIDSALRQLYKGQHLLVASSQNNTSSNPLQIIRNATAKPFLILDAAIIVFSVFFVVLPEHASAHKEAFGWVQSPFVKDNEGSFLKDLEDEGRIGCIPDAEKLCGENADCKSKSDKDCKVKIDKIMGGHRTDEWSKWKVPFYAFLCFALGGQIMFLAYALWIVYKILFLFAILGNALQLKKYPKPGLRIRLQFDDTEKRLGLGALDSVYNTTLFLVVLVSLAFALQTISNMLKGTSWYRDVTKWELVGQLALPLIVGFIFFVILCGPAMLFVVLTSTERNRELERIEDECAEVRKKLEDETSDDRRKTLEAKKEKLEKKKEMVRVQFPWPIKDAAYKYLSLVSASLLIFIPSGIKLIPIPGLLPNFLEIMRRIPEILCKYF